MITTEKNAIGSEKNGSGSEKSSEKNQAIISAIRLNPKVTAAEIAMKLGVSSRAVEKRIKTLRENGVIRRIGGDKGGYWEVIENGMQKLQKIRGLLILFTVMEHLFLKVQLHTLRWSQLNGES